MTECPHCGGTTGFGYVLIVRYFQTCTWDGQPDGGTTEMGGSGHDDRKLIECQDCSTMMRRSTLEKLQTGKG